MKPVFWVIGLTILTSGCGTLQPSPAAQDKPDRLSGLTSCGQLAADQQLVMQLSEDMVAQGRLHAALAHLQQLPDTLPEVRLRKAVILRRLHDDRAEPLYHSLMDSCLVAQAHYGLGQLAAARGDYASARIQLQEAAQRAPADAAIRNDLGFVYLQSRELDKARFEFLTAVELSEDNALPLENLLTLLIYENRWSESSALLGQKKVSPEQYQRAEARARSLQLEDLRAQAKQRADKSGRTADSR